MDSAHKAERPRLASRGRSSLFSIYLTWLQYAANYHRDFDCSEIVLRSSRQVKGGFAVAAATTVLETKTGAAFATPV